MTPIEKLARRICWLGFSQPTKSGWTEAAYWRSLPIETLEKYREEARWLVWAVGALDDSGGGWDLLYDARRAVDDERRAARLAASHAARRRNQKQESAA